MLALDSSSSHSNPPSLVDRITPSPPTAQPCLLSLANLIELIELPCGRGFCHCQPLKGSWAREVVTRNNSSAQQTDVVRMEAVEACFVLNSPRGTIPIQKVSIWGGKIICAKPRESELSRCPISFSLSIPFLLTDKLKHIGHQITSVVPIRSTASRSAFSVTLCSAAIRRAVASAVSCK